MPTYVLNKHTIPYIQDVCTFLALSMLELFVDVCYRPMFPKSFRIMSIKQSNYISPVSVKRPECYGPINRMNPIATYNTTTKFNKKDVHLLDILFTIRLSTLTELCVIHAWLMTRINFWYAVIVLIRGECVPRGGHSLYEGYYICSAISTPLFWVSGKFVLFRPLYFSKNEENVVFRPLFFIKIGQNV